MAEERNTVGSSETAEIKHEIERARVEMSQTIGEIQDRLSPDNLLQQAKDGVKDAAADKARSIMNSAGETAATVAYQARGVGDSLASYGRRHPIQVALAAGAVAWMIMRSRSQSPAWYGTSETGWEDEDAMSFDEGRSLRSRVGEWQETRSHAAPAAGQSCVEAHCGVHYFHARVNSSACEV